MGWKDAAPIPLLLLMLVIGGFPGIVHGVLREGLYMSNKTDILFIFNPDVANGGGVDSVYKQDGRITGLTYDKCTDQLFWSNVDVVNRGIYRGSMDAQGKVDNNFTKIIDTDVLEVSGLSFDWVSKNLYWTDSRKKTVEVSDMDGKKRRILVMTGKGSPRGIYADPINGFLFWTDQGQKHIARSNLDGSDMKVIVSQGVSLPNQIAVYDNKLYWVDSGSKTFESSNLDGSSRATHSISKLVNGQHIFGMAIHDRRAHITNWKNGQLIGVDIDGRNIATGAQNLGSDELFSAIYVKSTYQPKRNDTCSAKGCTGLCLRMSGQQARCTCSSFGGKVLGSDGKTCTAPSNQILLVAMADAGYVGFFDASDDHRKKDFYVVGRSLRPVAVAYDPVTKNVFWSDVRERSVHMSKIDGNNHVTLLRNNHGVGLVEGMVVDVTRRQLYYTNIGSVFINGTPYSWHRIETFSLLRNDNLMPHSVKVKTIVTTADKPRGLALDSANGHIYYTDWGSRASIVRVNLDGSNPTLLKTGLENPNGIVLFNNKIYFVDSHFKSRQETIGQTKNYGLQPKNGSVYSMDLNGANHRNELATTGVKLRTPFGLTATPSGLYVGDWETENLILLNSDGTLSQTILQGTSGIMSLAYTPYTATAELSSCASKRCDDISFCLSKSATEVACTCNSYGGKSLANSANSCAVPNNFLVVADMNSIKIVSQDGKDTNAYVAVQGNPFMANFVGLAYDNTSRIVYYSDISGKAINALHLSNMTSVPFFRINEVIDGMVFHEGSLYWTDYTNGRIKRLRVNPPSGTPLLHENLILGLSRPRGILIHNNYIYWTEWGGTPRVARKRLSGGTAIEPMVNLRNLVWPNGISISNGRLFVVDGSTKKLFNCGLNPSDNCQPIAGTENVLKHAYDLWTTDGTVFYYSDWNTGSIKAFDSSKPGKTWTIVDGLMRPTQFHVFPLTSRPPSCSSGTCSGGSCVPLLINPGCDCQNKVPTYDLKNCSAETAMSCSSGGQTYSPDRTYNPSPCLNCRCLGRRSWANDPVYNDSVCERVSCPKLTCESGETQTLQDQCCPICKKCGIRITNCPDKPMTFTLPSNQGYVVYDFLPTIKDCFGLAREVSTTRKPEGAIYRRGKTEVTVNSYSKKADGNVDTHECKINVIVTDRTPPSITCPEDIRTYLTGDRSSVEVKWTPPVVIENDVLNGPPVASKSWGSSFGAGVHNISYTATDESGLKDSCSFIVTIEKLKTASTCQIPQVDNAVVLCSAASSLHCLINDCKPDYKLTRSLNVLCKSDGQWDTPITDDIIRSTCIKIIATSVHGSLQVTAKGDCSAQTNFKYTSDFVEDAIKKELMLKYSDLKLAVKAKCSDSNKKDLVLDIDVIGKSSLGRDVVNITNDVNEVLNNIQMNIEREFIRIPIDGGTKVAHDVSITKKEAKSGCLPGQVVAKQEGECEVCSFGTYHEISNQSCVRCPPDKYNNETGQTECKPCPEGTKSGPGSYFVEQCITVSSGGGIFGDSNILLIIIIVSSLCFLILLLILIICCVRRRRRSKASLEHPVHVTKNMVYDPDLDYNSTYDKIADPMPDSTYDKIGDPLPDSTYDKIGDPTGTPPSAVKNNYESLETAAGTTAAANPYETIARNGDKNGKEEAGGGEVDEDGKSTPPYLEPVNA